MQPHFPPNLQYPGSDYEKINRIQHYIVNGGLEHFDTVTNKITPCDCPLNKK